MGKVTSLFEAEFQNYLVDQFKNLPIPSAYFKAYQKKMGKMEQLEIGQDHFWLQKEKSFQKRCELLFSSFLSKREISYVLDAIPKIAIPLTGAMVSRKEFSSPFALFKLLLDKRLALIYESLEIDCAGAIGCFTWVMPDGYGDWIALKKGMEILKIGQPNLEIKGLCLYEASWKGFIEDLYHSCQAREDHAREDQIEFVAYSKEKPSDSHSVLFQEFSRIMQPVKWLLQFPTYYVGIDDLMKNHSMPIESFGQYGFLLAPPFSPLSNGKSMGLHPLEMGILLREEEVKPQLKKIQAEYPFDSMALAYLKTEKGALTYLFLIASMQARFLIRIAILMPTFACLKESLENEIFLKDLLPILKGKIIFKGQDGLKIERGEGAVVLQVIEMGPCSEEELFSLAASSTLPIGCRGDQSFTEAVSLQKPFFYDAPEHAVNFLIDLVHFSEFHISSESLAQWFEGSSKALAGEDPLLIGKSLASLYQDLESLHNDFAHLSQKIAQFANGNQYLRGRLKRIFLHMKNPAIKAAEAELYESLQECIIKRSRVIPSDLQDWNWRRGRFEEMLKLNREF